MAYRKKGPRIGHPHFAKDDPRYHNQGGPVTRGRTRREGIPIPTADPNWLPEARSWFNSLALSGQSEFYEASDWATGVAAASALNMALRDRNASLFASFTKLSERLAVTHSDRLRARIVLDEPDQADRDEDHADNVIQGWQARLAEARKVTEQKEWRSWDKAVAEAESEGPDSPYPEEWSELADKARSAAPPNRKRPRLPDGA